MNKSTPMTFLIAALTVSFIIFSMFTWFDTLSGLGYTLMVAMIGLALAYFAIKISRMEMYLNRGLLWAGVILIFVATFSSYDIISENMRPLVVGGLLVASLFFGTKYKQYLI